MIGTLSSQFGALTVKWHNFSVFCASSLGSIRFYLETSFNRGLWMSRLVVTRVSFRRYHVHFTQPGSIDFSPCPVAPMSFLCACASFARPKSLSALTLAHGISYRVTIRGFIHCIYCAFVYFSYKLTPIKESVKTTNWIQFELTI